MRIVARALPTAFTASCKVSKLRPLSTTVKAFGTGCAMSTAVGSAIAAASALSAKEGLRMVGIMGNNLPPNG